MLAKFLAEVTSALVFPAIFWLGIKLWLWGMKQERKKKEDARKEELRKEKIQRDIDREKSQRNSRIEYI
jgi:hypothetical protein